MNAQAPPPPESGVRPLRALLVYESMFGNTELVASAVATGLRREGVEVTTFEVNDAPAHDAAPAHDLLVVGAPTHAFSLSRHATREDAVRQGAEPARAATGLREWIDTMSTTDHGIRLAACFDTRVTKVRRLPKAASTRAAHLLRRHGATLVDRPSGFLVHDTQGPLEPDELARAEDWGARLAEQVKARLAVTTAPEHH
jgi:flavodoxin